MVQCTTPHNYGLEQRHGIQKFLFPGTLSPIHCRSTAYDCQLMLLHLEVRDLQPRGILALVANNVPVDCQRKNPRMFPFLSFIIYLCIPCLVYGVGVDYDPEDWLSAVYWRRQFYSDGLCYRYEQGTHVGATLGTPVYPNGQYHDAHYW